MSQAEKKVKKNGMEDRLALRVWGEGGHSFIYRPLECRSIEY